MLSFSLSACGKLPSSNKDGQNTSNIENSLESVEIIPSTNTGISSGEDTSEDKKTLINEDTAADDAWKVEFEKSLLLGIKMPVLTWSNEIMPIKQGAPVMITLFGGFVYMALLFAGFMFLPGWILGFCGYMSCFVGVNLFISVLAYLCGYGKKVLPFWGFYNNEEHVESLSILCYIPLCMIWQKCNAKDTWTDESEVEWNKAVK